MKSSDSILKNTIFLVILTLVLGLLLSFTYTYTAPKILEVNNKNTEKAYMTVCPSYASSVDILDKIYNNDENKSKVQLLTALVAKNSSGEACGYIFTTSTKGYSNNLKIVVGFDLDGNIIGINYPETLQETPGLGTKIADEKFLSQFPNKNINNINELDTISGATISSTAVVNSIKFCVDYVEKAKNIK